MPLSENEKSEARDAIALALELNEPETMIEGLKRLCAKKATDTHLGDNERARFRLCADALIDVQAELERANALQTRSLDAPTAQTAQETEA